MIYLANDKYRASLRSTWIATPPDTTIQVDALPLNIPTLVTVGWGATYETVFIVEGKSGTDPSNYALTGVTRLKGANENIPIDATVNCLNNEEFFNQFVGYMGIDWKGEWVIGTTYNAGEGVSYDGSSYIALVDTTGDEPPADGIWQLTTLRGASWSHGAGAPSDANGIDGDFYLNETNDDVYVKASGTWGVLVNIKGEQGIQGEQGEPGVSVIDSTSLKNTTYLEDTTNTNTYAANFAVSPGSYFAGLKVNLKVTNANTGAATLNVNSLGAKSIKKNVVDDVEADDIRAGQVIPLIYDGTNFQIVGGGGTGGGADVLAVQVFS